MNFFLTNIIIYVLLSGCNVKDQKKCNIAILNNSTQKIDSIKITSYRVNVFFTNLLPHEKVEKPCTINYSGQYEGAFLLSMYVKDSLKGQTTFGYYSKPGEIKAHYYIEILNDFTIKEK